MILPEYPKKKVIFCIDDYTNGRPSGGFGLYADETDHFYFLCPECRCKCIITKIGVTDYEGYPELYFTLFCKECSITGTRKIWGGVE